MSQNEVFPHDSPFKSTVLTSGKRIGLTAVVFLLTLLVHSVIIFSVFPPTQIMKYPKTAEECLQNKVPAERLLDFSPLYLQIHVITHRIFNRPNYTVQWIHLFLTSLSACLLFQILLRFFPFGLAIGGLITFILNRSVIVYTHVFEPEPLMMFLLLTFLFLIIQDSLWTFLGAGIVLGLAVWTRPNFVPLILVIPFYIWFRFPSRRIFLRASIYCCLPILIALIGLWLRNTNVAGYFSPIVMNPGTALFEGNNPVSRGFSSIYPPLVDDVSNLYRSEVDYHHVVYRAFARKIAAKDLTLPEVNKYWTSKAIHFLIDHPTHALKLFATKFFHFFHNFEWHDLANAHWNERILQKAKVPTIPFACISAMAIFGFWTQRSRWKELLLFYGMFVSQFLFMMAIYVSARQRNAIIPLFIFFACGAVHYVLVTRKWFRFLAIVVPLAVLLYIPSYLMVEENKLWQNIRNSNSWRSEAYKKRAKNKLKEASGYAARALAVAPFNIDSVRPSNLSFEPKTYALVARDLISPFDFSSRFDRSVLSLEDHKAEDVRESLKEIVSSSIRMKRDYYQSSQPYYYLGRASLLELKREQALQNFRIALQRSPGDPWTLASLYTLTNDGSYSRQLFRYFDDIDARFFLGQAALEFGNANEAVRNFKYITDLLPEYRRGWVYLAAASGKMGNFRQGAEYYKHALKLGLDPALLENEILSLYNGLLKQNPEDADVLHVSGFVFRQYGHYGRALELQKSALQLRDSNAIRSEIATLEKVIASGGSPDFR